MKKFTLLCLSALLLLTLTACGESTRSYAYYEFVCDGDMTVTHGSEPAVVLSEEDETALLKLWGGAWSAGRVSGSFDYSFAWEDTTVHYNSRRGMFRLGDSKQILELSAEQRDTVERILRTDSE